MHAVPCWRISVLAEASSAIESNVSSPAANVTTPYAPDSFRAFKYSRASPALRWPDLQLREPAEKSDWKLLEEELDDNDPQQDSALSQRFSEKGLHLEGPADDSIAHNPYIAAHGKSSTSMKSGRLPAAHPNDLSERPRSRRIRLSKLALKKAKDWRERVQRLSTAICDLGVRESVADLLADWEEQLSPTDMCFVLKRVGGTHWQRALELYEWLNLRHWYKPNSRMLAGILSVLSRANQVQLAEEIFQRAEPSVGNYVQVFNAMMSVYARQGNWDKVQELLSTMSSRGCDPDLITYNTVINARCKTGMKPGMAIRLLKDMKVAGLTPDVVTYNTLISACSSRNDCSEAEQIFQNMKRYGCEPDIWTYNAMISVYGRSGADEPAKELFDMMQTQNFVPDAVTYNSILYAFAKSGRVDDVDKVRMQMNEAGCRADEITYNTMIAMYGKLGMYPRALSLYHEMTNEGCHADAVTFTVLIDALGKAGLVGEAEKVFARMADSEVRPSLQAFSAMICAYARAGMSTEAELTYDCMLQTGVVPDNLVFNIMLDLLQKADMPHKGVAIYLRSVKSTFRPELGAYEALLRWLFQTSMLKEVEMVSNDLQCAGFESAEVYCTFLNAGLYHKAADAMKLAAADGFIPNEQLLLDVLKSYHTMGEYSEAQLFVRSLYNSVPQLGPLTHLALIAMLSDAKQVVAAKEEFEKFRADGKILSLDMYRTLLVAFEDADMLDDVVEVIDDMQRSGVQPDEKCQKIAASSYCRLGLVDSAYKLVSGMTLSQKSELALDSYVCLIEAYGKQRLWERAESMFREAQQVGYEASTRAWNALISAYANCGQHENAKFAVSEMIKAGKMPTTTTCTAMLQAVINAGKFQDIRGVLQEMRQFGVSPTKNVFLDILNSSACEGKVHVAKSVFFELKGAGYLPNMQAYKILILRLSKARLVRDAEAMIKEMESDNLSPDVTIYNSMISLYSKTGYYKKAAEVFQGMQAAGCLPDSHTFNSLIWLYSRCLKIPEALALVRQMEKAGYSPTIESYTALISACGRLKLVDAAEVIFKDLQESGCRLNNLVFHAMMNVYRSVKHPEKVKEMLNQMKAAGIAPSLGTFHVLMDSYGRGGDPIKAEAVLDTIEEAGFTPGPLQHAGVVNAYLKNKDHDLAIEKLLSMKNEGFEPNYVIWTSFVSAASQCEESCEAIKLLTALANVGFALPLRLLKEKNVEIIAEVDHALQGLEQFGLDAGLGLVNVLLDLLWGFQRRATAAKVFTLAVQRNIYSSTMARVQVKNWGADFRRLSAGAALVALTLWLDQMQDASLQGFPESSKSVTIVTGCSRTSTNKISVAKTLKVHLWTIGSPFLKSKVRTGVLVAKGHALRMWLKDSSHCTDLELKNFSVLPEMNTMKVYARAFMRAELIPALQQIDETMGDIRRKKFSRLINLPEAKRNEVISAELKAKEDMSKKSKFQSRSRKKIKFKRRLQRI